MAARYKYNPFTGNYDEVGSAAAASGVVPVGGIIMWSGTIAAIPATWALCDGTLNAPGPDLRDKFVVGATADDAGVAKTNIRGSLEQSGAATGHSHSGHANLTHAGITIGNHTGLTHALAIANHPDLTHAALSHPAYTLNHADISFASMAITNVGLTHADLSIASQPVTIVGLTHADISAASFTGSHASGTFSVPSGTFSVPSGTFASHTHASVNPGQASLTLSISSQGTARTIMTGSSITVNSITGPSGTIASSTGTVASSTGTVASQTHTHAAVTITQPSHPTHTGSTPAVTVTRPSHPTHTGSSPAVTLTQAGHSVASLSHQAIGTHVGTDYGVHTITQPADHGAAGTLTHSFSQPNDHVISAHDTISHVPSFFALALIQRMS